jgi:hypothetical protein
MRGCWLMARVDPMTDIMLLQGLFHPALPGHQDGRLPAGAAMDEIRQRLDPAAELRVEGMR